MSITIIQNWFDKYKSELPPNLPPSLLITALTIVMKNNVFTFGDTFLLQKTGTAMGTPYIQRSPNRHEQLRQSPMGIQPTSSILHFPRPHNHSVEDMKLFCCKVRVFAWIRH